MTESNRTEENQTHTPGPWEYWPASNYEGFAIAPRGTLPTLASVERCGHMVNIQAHNFPGQTEANARLIAAAPDMANALRRALSWLSSYQGNGANGAYRDAVNALKKAGCYD